MSRPFDRCIVFFYTLGLSSLILMNTEYCIVSTPYHVLWVRGHVIPFGFIMRSLVSSMSRNESSTGFCTVPVMPTVTLFFGVDKLIEVEGLE